MPDPDTPQPEPTNADLQREIRTLSVVVKRIEYCLTGINGEITPEKGLVSRVVRLEEKEKTRARVVWVAVTTAVGSGVAAMLKMFGIGGGGGQ